MKNPEQYIGNVYKLSWDGGGYTVIKIKKIVGCNFISDILEQTSKSGGKELGMQFDMLKSGNVELLPLYFSPLYKAMNESEEK